MEKITLEYYKRMIRPYVREGDLMLFRGKRALAKTIQYFDNAYFNHIGIVWEKNGRFFIMDSNATGVKPAFLSDRCMEYVDVCVLRPHTFYFSEIPKAIESVFAIAEDGIKYDYFLLPRIALARKTGIEIKRLGNDKRDICSEWARRYVQALGIKCFDNEGKWVTPQDFIRMQCADIVEVIAPSKMV